MVLQRAPQQAILWGFGEPGAKITTELAGKALTTTVSADGVWRQVLPPTPASTVPTDVVFSDEGSTKLALRNVLFGDVFICSGQSNMQYTPHSMAGMNNLTAELAAAEGYKNIKFFTVGMETNCGHPTECSKPFLELAHGENVRSNMSAPCRSGSACREVWEPAGAASFGSAAWDHFSAVCFLTGRDIYDELGGEVPIGLISSNWGGT